MDRSTKIRTKKPATYAAVNCAALLPRFSEYPRALRSISTGADGSKQRGQPAPVVSTAGGGAGFARLARFAICFRLISIATVSTTPSTRTVASQALFRRAAVSGGTLRSTGQSASDATDAARDQSHSFT